MDFLSSLDESLADRVLALDDLGWTSVFSQQLNDDEGLDLDTLKRVSRNLRELTATHPLFTRGAELRGAYVFGRGMSFANAEVPRVKRILEAPQNQSALFSTEAFEMANRALFTDGIFVVIKNVTTNRFIQVPLTQISSVVTNPYDTSDWWYILRTWSANGEEYSSLIPLSRRYNDKPNVRSVTLNGETTPVDHNYRAYVKHTKRQTGWLCGVPDSMAAMIYALQYSGYLRDQATLVHALSKFAWNVTSSSARKTDQIKTRVEKIGEHEVGNVAVGNEVAGVGVPSAQVNFNNGQPLAALVAASFGVPVIALLSSPGATGGSYGAAQTLDAPTLKGFEVVQNSWATFYQEIILECGAKNVEVGFASIESDPTYRQISSIAQAFELGLIWGDEARDAVVDLLDVPVLHDTTTKPPLLASTTSISSQGNSADGVSGATTNPGGDTNNDNANSE